MTVTIAVAGATGYAGSEILRLLLDHPNVKDGSAVIGPLTAHTSVGRMLGEYSPHLTGLCDRIIEDTTAEVLSSADVVFLGLPHGFSAEIATQLPESTVILDCGADFRLKSSTEWEKYYASPHAGSWAYGIPEMPGHREAVCGASRIAVPGCFPTGATLAAYPALAAGLVQPTVTVVSVTGVSGGGKKPSLGLLGAETMGSLKAYNTAGKHRHTPEMIQNLSEATGGSSTVSVSFTPILAPLPRGILTTAQAPLADGVDEARVRKVYESFCADEPFLMLLPAGTQPATQSVVGSNMCQIQVEVNPDTQTLLVTSVIDNLVKGTAGAAVQCMNLALGWEETCGLPTRGIAP